MKTKDILLYLAVIVVSTVAGLWFIEYNKKKTPEQNLLIAQQEATSGKNLIERIPYGEDTQKQKAVAKQASIEQDFEIFLNDFLDDLHERMREYKRNRSTISSMIEPSNIRNDSYLEENRQMAQSLTAKMVDQSNRIINSFTLADDRIKALLSNHPNVDHKIILEKWRNVKNTQINNYISFFTFDSAYVDTHIKIIEFLMKAQGKFSVDVTKNELLFSDAQAKKTYEDLKSDISDIVAEQNKIFASSESQQREN